jgi:hypothetical protein
MTNKILLIDPPSGWLYGFPKAIPEKDRHRVLAWLVENGYPQAEIDSYGVLFYCRYIEKEVEKTL